MLDSIVIQSTQNGSYLKFSNPQSSVMGYPVTSIQAELVDRGMTASVQVYLYEPYELAAFFDDLTAHQTGWTGEKQWASIERHCALCCTVDNWGRIVMRVALRSEPPPGGVSMETVLYVDGKELGAIATQLKQFLSIGFNPE